jgi:hypothetical protein
MMRERVDNFVFEFGKHAMGGDYPRDTWNEIAEHVVSQLAAVLGHELKMEEGQAEIEASFGQGFSVTVRWVEMPRTGFAIRGVVGADIIGEQLLVRAWLYPYFGGVRLKRYEDGDVLELVYEKCGAGGQWQSRGWQKEEHGESDSFNELKPS